MRSHLRPAIFGRFRGAGIAAAVVLEAGYVITEDGTPVDDEGADLVTWGAGADGAPSSGGGLVTRAGDPIVTRSGDLVV